MARHFEHHSADTEVIAASSAWWMGMRRRCCCLSHLGCSPSTLCSDLKLVLQREQAYRANVQSWACHCMWNFKTRSSGQFLHSKSWTMDPDCGALNLPDAVCWGKLHDFRGLMLSCCVILQYTVFGIMCYTAMQWYAITLCHSIALHLELPAFESAQLETLVGLEFLNSSFLSLSSYWN